MNCLYITLFFNIVAGIVQRFMVFGTASVSPSHRSLPPAFWTTTWLLAPHHRRRTFRSVVKTQRFISSHNGVHKLISFLCVHLLRWKIVWRNALRIWRDFGSAMQFETRLTQTKPVLPLSNEHGSQVKDQGRRQCCRNKHKKFPYRPTCDVSLLPAHASYNKCIQF